MTSRTYDVILKVDNAHGFASSNFIVGNTSLTVAVIANVDLATNVLKVKLSNLMQEFDFTETIHSNSITTTATVPLTNRPFNPATMSGNVTTATATIQSVAPSTFIAEKNAFTQNPVVRLYTIYYPGDTWYPPNKYGNPTGQGAGRSWPSNFPIRFAEIRGDLVSDLAYNVIFNGESFIPYPINISGFDQSSDGKINDLNITIFNSDNIISRLVEDPFLVGNNTSNSVVALINSEYLHGVDPRTVISEPSDVGSVGSEAYDTLYRARANGLFYSEDVVGSYGMANASFTKEQTLSINGIWQEQKADTRDLLGGVVDITTTFANFLDVWPEYSSIRYVTSNVIEVYNAIPYRVGDNVKIAGGTIQATVQQIEENRMLFLSNPIDLNASVGTPLYIVNAGADSESYIKDTFKINNLESLGEDVGTFGLVSWLQYFKIVTPKRKYYKNTCQFQYKGAECQYPGFGELPIPGTNRLSNANPIAANNQIASGPGGDVCSKSLKACTIRNNEIHYGGFPATGRTIPRQ